MDCTASYERFTQIGFEITTPILCFTFLKVYDAKRRSLQFFDSEISPSSDISVSREGNELGGWLYFSVLRVFSKRERSDLSFGSCWQPRMGFQPSPEQIKAKEGTRCTKQEKEVAVGCG